MIPWDHPKSWRSRFNRVMPTIVNVYQTRPLSCGVVPQGLGDYIRGSLSVLQTARKLNIGFDMFIQHPVAKWLKAATQYTPNEIEYIVTNEQCLRALDARKSSNLFVYVHSFPQPVSDEERAIVWSKLQPSFSMISYKKAEYEAMGIHPGEYEVIHIRCGDKHIQHEHRHFQTNQREQFEEVHPGVVASAIQCMTPGVNYVVLSDNNAVKRAINAQFEGAIVRDSSILHLGTSNTFSDDGVRDTLLDFYIMTDAKRVTSLSAYSHGSGFSQWACELRKVPYTCKYMSFKDVTVVYKTYGPDLPWLRHSLLNLKKFVVYTELLIYVHDASEDNLKQMLTDIGVVARVLPVCYRMNGYVQQMIVKAECYKDVTTPYVVILDSDTIFTARFDLHILVEDKIQWTYSNKTEKPHLNEWVVWKDAYEAMTRTNQSMHFMSTSFPFVFTRSSMERAATEFNHLHGVDYATFCMDRLQKRNLAIDSSVTDNFTALATVFSEFEWLGFSCMTHSPKDYFFTTKQSRKVPIKQYWSHGGLTDEVLKELNT